MLKLLAPLLFLIGAVGVVVISDRPMPPADYTFAQINDFFTLDPPRMSYEQDLRMAYAIYEGLVRWDNETFEIEPALAKRWELSEDRRTYTFHLREEARWSNGDPVTAHDIHYSWQRAILPDTAADYAQLFFLIDGAEDYFNWRGEQLSAYAALPERERTEEAARALRAEADERYRETVGVRVIDAHTLEVRLQRPTPYFLDLCAFGVFYPVHRPTVERWASVSGRSGRIEQRHDWTKPGKIVTNGPYEVTSWRFKRDFRIERNPYYWNPEMVRSDSVAVVFISNGNTAVLAYQTGSVDWVENVVVDYLPEMIAQKERGERDDLHRIVQYGTYFWSFNCTPTLPDGRDNPFHDPRVRRAFAMSMNKNDIVNRVRRVGEPPATVFIPSGSIPGFDESGSIRGVGYDPAGARRLLAEAGWTIDEGSRRLRNSRGESFPVVELLCSTGSYHENVAQAFQIMWEETIGVQSRIVPKETRVFRDDLKRQNYMMARGGWFGDYGDPTTFLLLHTTGDGNNDRGFSDPHFDELVRSAEEAPTPEDRMRLLEEAERYSMEVALPVVPVFHYVRYYLYDPDRFSGISFHPRSVQYLWKLENKP